jgi:hypothetical protein
VVGVGAQRGGFVVILVGAAQRLLASDGLAVLACPPLSPGELARAYVSPFENRGRSDTRTAGVLHQVGVHQTNLDAAVVPVLPARTDGETGQTAGIRVARA